MRERVTIFIIIFIFSMMNICVLAEEEENLVIMLAETHVADHSFLTKEQIAEFSSSTIHIKTEDQDFWEVYFVYTYLCYAAIHITLDIYGTVYECNCDSYTQKEYNDAVDYKHTVWPSILAVKEWEQKYGPHELWDCTINAMFYQQYSHVPYESQLVYSDGAAHYDDPKNETIMPLEATKLAYRAIVEKFPEAVGEQMQYGIYFCQRKEGASYYVINYYSIESNTLKLIYVVLINSNDGTANYVEHYNGKWW